MGSVISYDEKCDLCGCKSLFSDCYYRTGEGIESCAACGYESSMWFIGGEQGRVKHNRKFLPFCQIRIEIRNLYTGVLLREIPLPEDISFEDFNILSFDYQGREVEILNKYGIDTSSLSENFHVALYYCPGGKRREPVRINYIGNWFEPSNSRNPRGVIWCIGRRKEKFSQGYGVMSISYRGKRSGYFRVFHRKPNIPHILKKWDRLTGSGYIPERSYLTVMEDDGLVFLKGKFPETIL